MSVPFAPPKDSILALQDVDHRARWQPGERLHHLFEQRCDTMRLPASAAHLAVDSAAARLTYAELDQLANRIARHLLAQGCGPGDVIGLLFDKSAWSYAAMLAALKIHAAYVPLDPGFPADRIDFIIGDAGVRLMLTTAGHRALLSGTGVPLCCVDECSEVLQSLPGGRLDAAEVGPPVNELCYVIYTSGSTGRPKGVLIDHASIINFVRVAAETYGYVPEDRVYQGLTLAFDFAVEEIWVPLAVGATLLPNQTGGSLLGQDLVDFLVKHRATAMCCVPTLLATLDDELPDLRLLIVSGEACPRDLVTRWHRPGRVLLNAYGPTEATVTATIGRPRPGEPVTIGSPLPTYAVVILEPGEARALAFGEIGEIGIAGIGIARGYLNRDEQTRSAFIADFLNVPHNSSGRIYRTGDLGRVNEHGEVEYLGRIDTQVKIRGYRIELSEIESVLMQVPQVAQAVVNTHESSPGVIELAAYYTLQAGGEPLAADDLAERLRSVLPSYMVPAFYEQLPVIPMLASDKADRKSLPPPSSQRRQPSAREFVAPEGPVERAIAGELAALLKLEQVSADDHFFNDLGANSLLMAQLSARLRRALRHESLSMRDIYAQPTVRGLAALVAGAAESPAPKRNERPPHVAHTAAYLGCGAAQVLLAFGFIWAHAAAQWTGWHWMVEASGWVESYQRGVLFSLAYFAGAAGIPIALKWLLVGRWKATEIPVWGLRYLRFWLVKDLVRINPMVLFAGTPVYVLYLRLLGARVAWNARIGLRMPPVCTDLIEIGDGAVIGTNSILDGYQVVAGRIRTGPIIIGARCHVGEGSLIDIDTVMADDSRLGHASSVLAGQRLEAGRCYHGSPAVPASGEVAPLTEEDERAERDGRGITALRLWVFSLSQIATTFGIFLPLPLLLVTMLVGGASELEQPLGELLGWSWAIFLASLPLGLLVVATVPRILGSFLKPGRIYKLYGLHHMLQQNVTAIGNSKFYNTLFGDSSAIVHYLAWIGCRFPNLRQTGSNFGLAQQQDNPALCEFGSGTMVSDGLTMLNADYGRHVFRVSELRLGADNFVGNRLLFPSEARTGDNCLFGTKVMVPIDGPVREGVGLLGSPSFEIPRSVRRDSQFDHWKEPAVLAARLRLKNRHNTVTALEYLLFNGAELSLLVVLWWATFPLFSDHGGLYLASYAMASIPLILLFHAAVDAASRHWRPLPPQYCSIYDNYFWFHERHWKLGLSSDQAMFQALSGTPFKGLLWRLTGVKVGRQLFDDGCSFPEKTLVRIGDYCTLGGNSVLQSHSLEDGTFKSDHVVVGNGCTVGANAYVHYGTRLEDNVVVAPDAFVMKGEQLDAGSVWCGNPARAASE